MRFLIALVSVCQRRMRPWIFPAPFQDFMARYAPGDIDRQMRVGADVAEVDRAGLTDAGGDAAVAAVLARRHGRFRGRLDLARR